MLDKDHRIAIRAYYEQGLRDVEKIQEMKRTLDYVLNDYSEKCLQGIALINELEGYIIGEDGEQP